MKYSYVFAKIILIWSIMFIFVVSVAAQESGSNDRFNKLEERIRALEEILKSRTPTDSQQPVQKSGANEIEELQRQVTVLSTEIEKLRSGEAEIESPSVQASSMGLSSSAASVYQKREGVSFAGYGEMLYQNYDERTQSGSLSGKGGQLDFLRAILYAGYRFNDKFVFNSEIEFEHANTTRGGEVSVEFAYLDYMANRHFTLRGGLVLIPMGLINEFHEPTAYLGARRTETETQIIPSTWRENGFGVLGTAGKLSYRAYLINGLDASRFSADGIRSGRQSGAKALAVDPAFVGRIDYAFASGIFAGGSIYTGNSGQGQFTESGKKLDVRTTIGEIHAQMQMRSLDLRALYARAAIADVAALNRLRGLSGENSLSERLQGGYVQFGYNLLSRFSNTLRLTPFYRYEALNTQAEVPQGYAKNPEKDRNVHTFGAEFSPIPNIAIKGDYQWMRNQASTGLNQFNINLGYSF